LKIEDLILPGAILIGGYFLLTKLTDFFNPSKAVSAVGGSVVSGVVTPAVETAQTITKGGSAIVELPKNIVTQNVPGLSSNTVDILSGLKSIPILGSLLDNPFVNTAVSGLSQTAKPKTVALTTVAYVKTKPVVGTPSERQSIPVSAINKNVPVKVQAKIKAGKVF